MPLTSYAHLLARCMLATALVSAQPTIGPFSTGFVTLENEALDDTNHEVLMVYPSNGTAGQLFPLIAYAHGAAGGNFDINGYDIFFHQLASFGYVIAAHKSCSVGCKDPEEGNKWTECAGVPFVRPPGQGWGQYYAETLKTIDWARNSSSSSNSSEDNKVDEGGAAADPVFSLIDWALGVGIAGHSMGGQSTSIAASTACAAAFDIKAAALHHPANGQTGAGILQGGRGGGNNNTGSGVGVPLAAFTSSGDNTCDANLTKAIYSSLPPGLPRAYRNIKGSSHLEPVLVPPIENPLLATYTAAWMQVHLGGNADVSGWDEEAQQLIYGSGPDPALCESQPMVECHVEKS